MKFNLIEIKPMNLGSLTFRDSVDTFMVFQTEFEYNCYYGKSITVDISTILMKLNPNIVGVWKVKGIVEHNKNILRK